MGNKLEFVPSRFVGGDNTHVICPYECGYPIDLNSSNFCDKCGEDWTKYEEAPPTEREIQKAAWFKAVNASCINWRRVSKDELVLWFEGYRSLDVFDASQSLMRLGASVLSHAYDPATNKTVLRVREPNFPPQT